MHSVNQQALERPECTVCVLDLQRCGKQFPVEKWVYSITYGFAMWEWREGRLDILPIFRGLMFTGGTWYMCADWFCTSIRGLCLTPVVLNFVWKIRVLGVLWPLPSSLSLCNNNHLCLCIHTHTNHMLLLTTTIMKLICTHDVIISYWFHFIIF